MNTDVVDAMVQLSIDAITRPDVGVNATDTLARCVARVFETRDIEGEKELFFSKLKEQMIDFFEDQMDDPDLSDADRMLCRVSAAAIEATPFND